MRIAVSGDRFGECFVASAPVVDDLWSRHSKTTRYLYGINEIIDIYFLSHGLKHYASGARRTEMRTS